MKISQDLDNIEETLYLESIPNMADALIDSLAERPYQNPPVHEKYVVTL